MTTIHSRPIQGYGSKFVSDDKYPHDSKLLLWPFGPVGQKMHGNDRLGFKLHVAKKVLYMVMDKSGINTENLLHELRNIVPELRVAYPDDVRETLDDEELIKLAADSTLFVLVTFSILGAKLDFPDQHVIFGTGRVKEGMEKWLKSIFFVGNQIPHVMVEALMKSLTYLKTLRERIRKRELPLEPLERTLYEFMTNDSEESKPVDVMHSLRSIILGLKSEVAYIWVVGSSEPTMPQLSASALLNEGYTFKPLPIKSGSREIKCETKHGKVVIHLPFLEVTSDMSLELLMNSVAKFEDIHGRDDTLFQPESRCYFSLLSNLVRSAEDVKVLLMHGVIGGVNLECLPRVLQHFYQMPQYDASVCVSKEILMYRPQRGQDEYDIFD